MDLVRAESMFVAKLRITEAVTNGPKAKTNMHAVLRHTYEINNNMYSRRELPFLTASTYDRPKSSRHAMAKLVRCIHMQPIGQIHLIRHCKRTNFVPHAGASLSSWIKLVSSHHAQYDDLVKEVLYHL
eukprot:6191017-Pleurochrysis_carterae.AAC.1